MITIRAVTTDVRKDYRIKDMYDSCMVVDVFFKMHGERPELRFLLACFARLYECVPACVCACARVCACVCVCVCVCVNLSVAK